MAVALRAFGLLLGISCWAPAALFVAVKGHMFSERHHDIEVIVTIAAMIFGNRGTAFVHGKFPSRANDFLANPRDTVQAGYSELALLAEHYRQEHERIINA
jgi:hypothetical protein